MIRAIIRVVIVLLLSVTVAEVIVRIAGFFPAPGVSAGSDAVNLNIEDPLLGWRNRPDVKQTYRTLAAPPHTITILEDGARATRNPNAPRRDVVERDVIFVGCSFTHGFGLNDEETFAWKVQAARPEWNVHNFGVNGFGTCQAYMLLKRLFEHGQWHKPVVIYGFIDDHEDRNVAYYMWHFALSRISSRQNALLPSCTLDQSGSIAFNGLHPYPQFPLRHTLATISLFEIVYLKLTGASRASQKQRVTDQLLIEMDMLTAAHSGQFGVLLFNVKGDRTNHYRQFLEKRATRMIGLERSNQKSSVTLTQADGHPNSRMTDFIAERVVKFVDSLGQ